MKTKCLRDISVDVTRGTGKTGRIVVHSDLFTFLFFLSPARSVTFSLAVQITSRRGLANYLKCIRHI